MFKLTEIFVQASIHALFDQALDQNAFSDAGFYFFCQLPAAFMKN
jgi:hypothetical protein